MPVRLQKDIEKLNQQIVYLGSVVEERFRMAIKSIETRDVRLARTVVAGDLEIDHMEVDIEEECLKILALHQPVANNLRYIVSILKMNNDLERIGDLAVNIAERAESLGGAPEFVSPFDYVLMAEKAGEMLKNSLDSLMTMSVDLAYTVCAADDEVDALNREIKNRFAHEVRKTPHLTESLLDLYLVARHLERIADHATNIAEDVIYMITGEIHRHRGGDYAG
jgi:phosphate transport system protein